MRPSLFVRLKSIIARDEYAFWFSEFTNEEKELAQLNAWELANVIHDCLSGNKDHQKRIFAAHLLDVRAAKIQAKPAYIAIFTGLVGIVAGAFLTSALQAPQELSKCVCECRYGSPVQKNDSKPVEAVPHINKPADLQKGAQVNNAGQSGAKSKP